MVRVVSIDNKFIGGVIRLGGLVESDKIFIDVWKWVMEVVDECGWRVIVGDVVSRVGLNVI